MARTIAIVLVLFCVVSPATAKEFDVAVLVSDAARPQYAARGTTYIEAIRGASYAIRLTNPTPFRVAVALSVDGLNTIDARHTDSWSAAKWVLDPYESTVISGWQVNDSTARRFFFTTEDRSYGAALGRTENLGVIEAVFYRERVWRNKAQMQPAPDGKREAAPSAAGAAPSDEYAATGMGGRTRHDVESVDIDLEPSPVATVRIRYEFRPQLVRLGVLPRAESPLDRRERAAGFDGFCPEP